MTLAGLAILDLSRKPAAAGVQLASLVTAIALATALPLMQAVAAEEGLQSTLRDQAAATGLDIGLDQVTGAQQFDAFEADVSRRVGAELGDVMIPAARIARSSQQQPVSLNGVEMRYEPGDPIPTVAYFEGLPAHVAVTSGAWPADGQDGSAWWATVSESGAQILGLKAGDLYCLGARGASRLSAPPWCARIGAVWKPGSANDPYWGGAPPGTELMLGRDSIFALQAEKPYLTLHAEHLFTADLGRIHAGDAEAIRARLQDVHAAYGVTSDATFISGLGDAIERFLDRLGAEQALATSVEVALLAVALFAIALSTIHFLEAQRPLVGLWRARGGSRPRAWALLVAQLAVLGLLALPAGMLVGVAAVSAVAGRLFGRATAVLEPGVLASSAPALGAAVAGGALVLAALAALATRGSVADARRAESRPAAGAWWRRSGVEAGLAAAGVLGLAEYRIQAGQITTSSGPDPLGLVLPGVALALLALGALRLVPLLARALAGSAGVGTRLARWRLERQPLQHARIALLLSIALALSVFTSTYLATDQRNAVDRARYAAGSDVRLSFGFGTAPSTVDQAVAAAPGVAADSRVYRGEGRPGRSDVTATVVGVDPYTFPAAAAWRSDYSTSSLQDLMAALEHGDGDGVALPGRPGSLSVWVYSPGIDASLTAQLRGADGRPISAPFGSAAYSGWRRLQAPLEHAAGGDYPLRLLALDVTPNSPVDAGELDFSDLQADGATVEAFTSGDGWWRETEGAYGEMADLKTAARRHDGTPAVAANVELGGGTLALRPAPSAAPLPGIISSATAGKLGVHVGQAFPLHIETNDVEVRLVGLTDYFPTLYPGQDDFLVVPVRSLTERLRHLGSYVYPNEAWLRVGGSPAAAAGAVITATHGQAQATDREALESAALDSPLRLSLDAALVIGFAAALAMVVIGFGLHFLATARARVGESAIMQANGLPWRVVDRALVVEQAVVLCHGIVSGAVLGAVLAWAILPVLQTSVLAADLIPPTVVTLDARTLAGAGIAVVAAAAAAGWLAIRAASGFRLADELRALA